MVPCVGVGWVCEQEAPGGRKVPWGKEAPMRVIERVAEHYDVQEMPFGRVYQWCPERVVVECICGKKTTHKRSELINFEVSSCGCGEDHTLCIWEELVIELVDEEYEAHHHPWDHDTQAQLRQHLRDEAAYPEDSPWRYNDVTACSGIEE